LEKVLFLADHIHLVIDEVGPSRCGEGACWSGLTWINWWVDNSHLDMDEAVVLADYTNLDMDEVMVLSVYTHLGMELVVVLADYSRLKMNEIICAG
jgi:hypothetical protein